MDSHRIPKMGWGDAKAHPIPPPTISGVGNPLGFPFQGLPSLTGRSFFPKSHPNLQIPTPHVLSFPSLSQIHPLSSERSPCSLPFWLKKSHFPQPFSRIFFGKVSSRFPFPTGTSAQNPNPKSPSWVTQKLSPQIPQLPLSFHLFF